MDPNYLKLYKMAQLIIEYLLVCRGNSVQQWRERESFVRL